MSFLDGYAYLFFLQMMYYSMATLFLLNAFTVSVESSEYVHKTASEITLLKQFKKIHNACTLG